MNKPIPLLGGLALAAFAALTVAPPALPAQTPEPSPEATAEPLYLPLLRLGTWTPPGASPTTASSPRPSDPPGTLPPPGTATPSPTASPEPGAATPGIPACHDTRGDAGGLRFSLDGGRSLAPNRQRLASLAYTWALLRDPRDPDLILELHEGRLYRSLDAGCSLSLLSTLPAGVTWDRLARAPGRPDFLVASSVFAHAAAWSEDGGATWTLEPGLPDDVVNLAIAADDPWHWAFAGRQGMAERRGREARWSVSPLPVGDDSIVSAAPLPGAWGRWLLGSNFHGPYHFDAANGEWRAVAPELKEPVGQPPEPVLAVVTVWVAVAPGDADVQFVVVNRVGRVQAQRAVWASSDGGASWRERVVDDQAVGDRRVTLTGGTRLFVSPHDPRSVFLPFGTYFDGYGTDLFRSADGLATLEVSHFDGFYEIMDMAWGPAGSQLLYVAASSDRPSLRRRGGAKAD